MSQRIFPTRRAFLARLLATGFVLLTPAAHADDKPKKKPVKRNRNKKPTTQPSEVPASQPSTQPAETVELEARRLNSLPAKLMKPADFALRAGLDFALALSRADGTRAAALVEVTGFQSLPLTGDLPEKPQAALTAPMIQQQVAARPKVEIEGWPLSHFELLPREAIQGDFDAVARWMLPHDYALVFKPQTDPQAAGWVSRTACIVIRVRGGKPTIVGGNLFEALRAD